MVQRRLAETLFVSALRSCTYGLSLPPCRQQFSVALAVSVFGKRKITSPQQAPELKIVCTPFEVPSATDENKVSYELARLVTLYRI
jgi:hypothetical protein